MVLCVGTAAYDLFFPLEGRLEEDRKYEVPAIQESGGGPAANAAFLLSSWGVPAALACVLGTTSSAAGSSRSSGRRARTCA